MRAYRILGLLVAVFALILGPLTIAQAQEMPNIYRDRIVLLVKNQGATEVTQYIRWTETSPRTEIQMVLDTDNLAVAQLAPVNGESVGQPTQVQWTKLEQATGSGAYFRFSFTFNQTQPGKQYQLMVGYASRLVTFPNGADSDGNATYIWQSTPWPVNIQTYEIYWITQGLKSNDFNKVKVQGNDWQVSSFNSQQLFPNQPAMLAVKAAHPNAAANWMPVINVKAPAAAFGLVTAAQPQQTDPVPPTVSVKQTQPAPAAQQSQAAPASENRGMGAFFIILIVVIVGGILAAFWFFTKRRNRPEPDTDPYQHSYSPYNPPTYGQPYEGPTRGLPYERPTVTRETRRSPKRNRIAKDMTMAEAAQIVGADLDKVVMAAVFDLERKGLITVLNKDPLQVKTRPNKVSKAERNGNLTAVDKAVIDAIDMEGKINPATSVLIQAAVRASVELKLREQEAQEEATRQYYQETIRRLEYQVAQQQRPTVYVQDNSDIWYWLWLSDRMHYAHQPVGYYAYPSPQTVAYYPVSSNGSAQPVPFTDDSFKQNVPDFTQPPSGLANDISQAAARAAAAITGSPEPEPAPTPHDACVQHSDCHTPHDACHTPHDACVQHSDCYSAPHDNCHTHSDCVHSDCVHSDCYSAPSSDGGGGCF